MADLERRTLGRTGLRVSVLGYGAMELRNGNHPGARPVDDTHARRLLNAVLDHGINFIDTSPDYGDSEEFIGRSISRRRNEFILATKCGCVVDHARTATNPRSAPHVFTRDHLVRGVERSLSRMRTDYLDVVQFHTSPSRQTLVRDDAVATLIDLRDAGKVRFIGASSKLPNLRDHIDMGLFDVFQIPYSAVDREHGPLLTEAAATGAGIVVRGRVAESAAAAVATSIWCRSDLQRFSDESPISLLIRFAISHPAVSATIVGTLDLDHLAQNVKSACRGAVTPVEFEVANRRLDAASTDLTATQQFGRAE